MSFEDLVNNRKFSSIRPIRDIFLAHKQENDFFNAFDASNVIKNDLIEQLLAFMEANANLNENDFRELNDNRLRQDIFELTKQILDKFEEDYFSGFRLSNNFLCAQKDQVAEISSGPIASVFYRYNSSKQLGFLSNYFISNLISHTEMGFVLLNAKVDYILHAVNMYDSIFKDTSNKHSIDGLYEILIAKNIGDTSALTNLQQDPLFSSTYCQLRAIRNKLAGHMDKTLNLSNLLELVEQLDFNVAFDFVNKLDKAVFETTKTHIAIKVHYLPNNPGALNLNDKNIISVNGLQNAPYFN